MRPGVALQDAALLGALGLDLDAFDIVRVDAELRQPRLRESPQSFGLPAYWMSPHPASKAMKASGAIMWRTSGMAFSLEWRVVLS